MFAGGERSGAAGRVGHALVGGGARRRSRAGARRGDVRRGTRDREHDDREHDDRREGGQGRRERRGPRGGQAVAPRGPLPTTVDPVGDTVEDPVRYLAWTLGEPGVEEALDRVVGPHAERPPFVMARASASSAARMARWA